MDEFTTELQALLEKHSKSCDSGVPESILAKFIRNTLNAFNNAVNSKRTLDLRTETDGSKPET